MYMDKMAFLPCIYVASCCCCYCYYSPGLSFLFLASWVGHGQKSMLYAETKQGIVVMPMFSRESLPSIDRYRFSLVILLSSGCRSARSVPCICSMISFLRNDREQAERGFFCDKNCCCFFDDLLTLIFFFFVFPNETVLIPLIGVKTLH
jgi:hypothetical protein